MIKLFKLPVKIERKAKVICLILFCSLAAFGQVQVSPFPLLKENLLDANGKPLAAGCVNFYAAGTTTPQATYVDSTGIAQNPNPIVLDAAGRVPSGSAIWLSSAAYKIRVFSAGSSNCASGTLQWEIDNFRSFSSLSGTETLSNKTLTSPTSTGTDSGTETLINKTLTAPTVTNPTTTGTDSGTETLTNKTLTSPVIATGVSNNGSGLKHARALSCTTASGVNSVCNTTITWGTPFADGSYTVTCTMSGSSIAGSHLTHLGTPVGASVVVEISNGPSGGAFSAVLNCIAIHD